MQKQTDKKASHNDLAPALDPDPVFERPAEERWEIAPRPTPFAPFVPKAAGPWVDTRSAFDVGPPPGPGFLDPGTHALLNHRAPLMASESLHTGTLAGASSDLLAAPAVASLPSVYSGSGGGDDDDGDAVPKPGKPPKR